MDFPFELIVYRSLPPHRQYNLSSLTKSIPHRWDYYHQRNISRVIYVIFPPIRWPRLIMHWREDDFFLHLPSFINLAFFILWHCLMSLPRDREKKTEARRDVRKNGWLFGLFCCWLQFCSLVSSCRYHSSFYDYSYRHKNLYCWRFFLMPSERMKCVKIYMRICVCAIRSGYSHEFLTKLWGVKWSKKGEVSNWWG